MRLSSPGTSRGSCGAISLTPALVTCISLLLFQYFGAVLLQGRPVNMHIYTSIYLMQLRERCPRHRAHPRPERGSQRPPVQQGTKFCPDVSSKEMLHVVWVCRTVFSRNIPQTRRFPRKWQLGSLRLAAHRTCSHTGLPVGGIKEKNVLKP